MENGIKNYSGLAKLCGVTRQQISQIMVGNTNAGNDLAKCIDKHLGLDDQLRWRDPVRANERKQAFYDAIGK
jgi:plasmid maintenance system antidote protein VapI